VLFGTGLFVLALSMLVMRNQEKTTMSFVKGLKCRDCGREYAAKLQAGCEECYGQLEEELWH
jgi:protein-arginine kinase activator protein McsA